MGTGALTESLDVAQVVLYVFWLFFFSLLYYLRREDRREGYPLESESGQVGRTGVVRLPKPKTFLLPHGGSSTVPNFARDDRSVAAEKSAPFAGAPLRPTGNPMVDGVGAGAYAMRSDKPELTREGAPLIQPMRVAAEFHIDDKRDPRGWPVVAADGKVAGVVKDLWIDRADSMIRYYEVELTSGLGEPAARRLLPYTMLRLLDKPDKVVVRSILSTHFASVPTTKSPDQVTVLEEERIQAFYAGGKLYATPDRIGPLV